MSAREGDDVMLNVVSMSNVFAMNAVDRKVTSFPKILVRAQLNLSCRRSVGICLQSILDCEQRMMLQCSLKCKSKLDWGSLTPTLLHPTVADRSSVLARPAGRSANIWRHHRDDEVESNSERLGYTWIYCAEGQQGIFRGKCHTHLLHLLDCYGLQCNLQP